MRNVFSSLLLSLLIASAASAVTMDWTAVANPGNPCDPQSQGCFGAVGYLYSIGTYEVTNAQYVEFLTAKAASDPYGLYNPYMGDSTIWYGGIARSGSDGSYAYTAIAGRENMPVNHVSFFDVLRFANWMNNGQGNADTETGAYTLYDADYTYPPGTPSNGQIVTRNPGATIVLPSEDEWYKAAYYNGSFRLYRDYPLLPSGPAQCEEPGDSLWRANCGFAVGDLTPVGSYARSATPYGTYDQGGNVREWNEAILGSGSRSIRGGSFKSDTETLAASVQEAFLAAADWEEESIGFRVAMIPEPGTGLLVIGGLLGLAGWRRPRA